MDGVDPVTSTLPSLKRLRELANRPVADFGISTGSLMDVCRRLGNVLLRVDEPFDESLCSKDLAHVVWAVLIAASRHKIVADSLDEVIGNSELARAVSVVYRESGEALRDVLHTIGWEYPKVVGIGIISSKLDPCNKSNADVEEPLAEITFKVLPTGETSADSFKFLCNKNQLQDLQWRVKEANNMLQRAAMRK